LTGEIQVIVNYLLSAGLVLLAAIIIFRIVVRRDYLQKGKLTPVSVFLETAIFFILGGFPYLYVPREWPAVKLELSLEIVGWAILVAGLVLMLTGMGQLGARRIFGQGSNNLEQRGLYSFSRNPQILGCWLYVVGFTALWPSYYALGWACLFGLVTHIMVLTEEEYLHSVFGEEFRKYCEKVPRYIERRSFLRGSKGI
jgi:protein-S-isoprenylcysteine O-methyltransferase Ste14